MPSSMNNKLIDKSIKVLSKGLKKKDFSSEELVRECYKNIDKYESSINSTITIIDKEKALVKAKEFDSGKSKPESVLSGIPYVLKDAYVTKGVKTTAASY